MKDANPDGTRTVVTTGFAGLDAILGGLRLGDNVVWRVDAVDDYRDFVRPFVLAALAQRRRVVYCRFAAHPPVVESLPGVTVYNLDAFRGFKSFTVNLHRLIAVEGREVCYVFDCLSDLLDAWATDGMIGNFFAVTCPYLFELDTIAYFAVLRGTHPFSTIARIRATTQLLIDLYHRPEGLYLHPLKVWQRSSPTMFLPHRLVDGRFVPITGSDQATRLFRSLQPGPPGVAGYLDHWERLFQRAAKLARGKGRVKECRGMVDELCRLLVGPEERILTLARRYLTLADLLAVKERLIGTGYLGGKAVGLLLARAILRADPETDWEAMLEPHDSFFVGSDLFFAYLVHNGWWPLFREHKSEAGYWSGAARLREVLPCGEFPAEVREAFQQVLEYFGQYPLIVRLSSLQEDAFGNAFAGKYGSYFCGNQGTPEERFAQFEEAVKRAYASTMDEDALQYRLERGLTRQEEHPALLVQRVAGEHHGRFFFPEVAGVGFSRNTFVWSQAADPKAGVLRLVLGLGTRATARMEGDYPRIVFLDQPRTIPFAGSEGGDGFSQRGVDLLSLPDNAWQTVPLQELLDQGVAISPLFLKKSLRRGKPEPPRLTFERLLAETGFPDTMARLLAILEEAYAYPVDVEFTGTVSPGGQVRINLLQCRPLQTRGAPTCSAAIPERVPGRDLLFRSRGNFMGGSLVQPISRVIQVLARPYLQLSVQDRYELARLIGRLNRLIPRREELPTLLLAPGRLGTSSPELGVAVRFAEINGMAALVEVGFAAGALQPDLSFGSHFFQDLVESGIFYAALFPGRDGCQFNEAFLEELPNRLPGLLPEYRRFAPVVRVVDLAGEGVVLLADLVSQQVVCGRIASEE